MTRQTSRASRPSALFLLLFVVPFGLIGTFADLRQCGAPIWLAIALPVMALAVGRTFAAWCVKQPTTSHHDQP